MKYREIFFNYLAIAIILFLISLVVSYLYGSWFGYPRGYDALFHLFKSKYILLNWPNHDWWYIWTGGMPLLLYYPALPYLFIVLFKVLTGASFEIILNTLAILAIALSGFALYLLIFRLTKDKTLSFLGSLFYITCPSSWESALMAGVYMRALAMPFFVFGLCFSLLFWQEFEKGIFNKKLFVFTSLSFGLCVLTHQHTALISFATLFFLTFFIVEGNFIDKAVNFMRITILSLLLSASFWLPLLVFFPNNPTLSWVPPNAQQSIHWKDLLSLSLSPNYINFTRLSPFLFPLAIFLTILVFSLRSKRLKEDVFLVKTLKFSGWMVLLWLFYSTGNLARFGGNLPLVKNLYSFLGTEGATWFLPIFLSLAICILFSFLLQQKKWSTRLIVGTLVLLVTLFTREQYLDITSFYQKTGQPTQVSVRDFSYFGPKIGDEIKKIEKDNFRLGLGATTTSALEFNDQFPNLPQTENYFAPGILNFNLFYYLETAFTRGLGSENEVQFLLDWWGIKPILAQSNIETILGNKIEVVGSEGRVNLYTYKNSSPLLGPNQAMTVLMIGSEKSYQDSFFRSLAIGNINSHLLIPIPGKSVVEGYNQKSLSDFDIVFLYDYKVNSFTWAAGILNNYVKKGGNLIIESNRDVETGRLLPDPFPVRKIKPAERIGDWNFNVEVENSSIDPNDLVNFSPAAYEGGSWGISEGDGVKDWAKTILTSEGKPILVEGRLGEGKVLWSGLNLSFHITQNRNEKEAKLLEKTLLGFASFPNNDLPNFKVEFKNPQERVLFLESDARGVLFKENYFPNWHAVAKTARKKVGLKIYPAGPGFMFAYLPQGTKEVTFLYRHSFFERVADIISIFTFFWLVWFLVRTKPFSS